MSPIGEGKLFFGPTTVTEAVERHQSALATDETFFSLRCVAQCMPILQHRVFRADFCVGLTSPLHLGLVDKPDCYVC